MGKNSDEATTFSEVETSKHPTSMGDSDKGNRNNYKNLNFIP